MSPSFPPGRKAKIIRNFQYKVTNIGSNLNANVHRNIKKGALYYVAANQNAVDMGKQAPFFPEEWKYTHKLAADVDRSLEK
jgi:hypothetical protein